MGECTSDCRIICGHFRVATANVFIDRRGPPSAVSFVRADVGVPGAGFYLRRNSWKFGETWYLARDDFRHHHNRILRLLYFWKPLGCLRPLQKCFDRRLMLSGSAPTFTPSLDCEGLWGMADRPHLLESGVISRGSLSSGYEFRIRTLLTNGRKGNCCVCLVLCSWL